MKISEHGSILQLTFAGTLMRRPIIYVSAYYFDNTLIDTGPPKTARELSRWAREQRIERIVNSHHHEDHIGGNALLDAPAFAPAETIALLREAARLPLYRRLVWGQPRALEASPLGGEINTTHYMLKVIHTPGQAPDHVAFLLPEEGWLFSGDLYIGERTRYLMNADDINAWLGSLHNILRYPFDTLFCCHAGHVPDAKNAIRRKIAYWEELGDRVQDLAARGWADEKMRDELLGPEGFITRFSRGQYSKLNLIRALLTLQSPSAKEDNSGAVPEA